MDSYEAERQKEWISTVTTFFKERSGWRGASWLVCSSPDRAVRVRALAGDVALCSWASLRQFILTVPLSTQVYKWVPAEFNAGGSPAMD